MEISEAIDRGVKACWRHDLINMLTDAGRTLAGTGLRANGSVYRDINIGMLLLEAARSLQECQDRQRYLDIGLDSGAQIVHDMLCVALRDKQAMGDDVWGKERIVRLLTRLNELKEEFGPAFRPGPEQDYMQEQLDGALREIFGEATVPFAVRHPYIREIDYTKRRR